MRKKHPYYDSDRKKRTEDFATKAIAYSLLGIIIIFIFAGLFGCGNVTPKQANDENLFVPTEEDIMVLDTLYDMVKETEQDIDSIFIDIDKINQKLDDLIEQKEKEAHSLNIQKNLEDKDPDYMYMDTTLMLDEGDEFAYIYTFHQLATYENSEEDLDYYDSDAYMELWYTKIDTNGNGEPDDIEGLY